MEQQLNIEGKRSGQGIVAHKATLLRALGQATASRINIVKATLERKGFVAYLKTLTSNIVKIVPQGSSLKVSCGGYSASIPDGNWLKKDKDGKDKTPFTYAKVIVSPKVKVIPNIGSVELAVALARVLPFIASGDDERKQFQRVRLEQADGKLVLVATDGIALATTTLDFEDGDNELMVSGVEVRELIAVLKRATRLNLSITGSQGNGDKLTDRHLVFATPLVTYDLLGDNGIYPEWRKLIPQELPATSTFDTLEAVRAVQSLYQIAGESGVDITIGQGSITFSLPEAQEGDGVTISADTQGEPMVIRANNIYLLKALKACGDMVEVSVKPDNAIVFNQDGFTALVMPMARPEAQATAKVATASKAVKEPSKEAVSAPAK